MPIRRSEELLLDACIARVDWRDDLQCILSNESLHQLSGQRQYQHTSGTGAGFPSSHHLQHESS